jgi:hypothetical protein
MYWLKSTDILSPLSYGDFDGLNYEAAAYLLLNFPIITSTWSKIFTVFSILI